MSMIPPPPAMLSWYPRPHPLVTGPAIFFSRIPADLPDQEVLQVLSEYGPFTQVTGVPVEPSVRLLPDPYYNGMVYSMTVAFQRTHSLETALACFPSTHLAHRGIAMSFSPFLEPLPRSLHPAVARLYSLKHFYDMPNPTHKQLFDAVRHWGAVESMTLLRAGRYWTGRIQFHYEDEAARFELEFPGAGFHGWDVTVWQAEAPQFHGGAMQYSPPKPMAPVPFFGVPPFPHYLPPPSFANFMPTYYETAHPEAASVPGVTRRAFSVDYTPRTPMYVTPPPQSMPLPTIPLPVVTPPVARDPSEWKEYQDFNEDGAFLTMGVKDQYDQKVPHKKGQHIRLVKGENHSSGEPGLVDYCNLRIKGLTPDINDVYLREICQGFQGFVGSSVSRDARGRPKGHGFANFELPSQAQAAMDALQGRTVGSKNLVVSFHEPNRLKPHKLQAARPANGPS